MQNIYDNHLLVKHLTIDDLLVRNDITHAEYRSWLVDNNLPLYPLTKGLYDEALLSDDPRYTHKLTRQECNKVLYSAGWTEPRRDKTNDIITMLEHKPPFQQDYIAYKLNITQARVSQVAQKYNLRPKRKQRNDVSYRDVQELWNKEHSAKEIAKLLNISLATVYKKLSCKNI